MNGSVSSVAVARSAGISADVTYRDSEASNYDFGRWYSVHLAATDNATLTRKFRVNDTLDG
ncbi:hypothetical protein GCM10020366_27850 [Saccharopolyspora gregorii]|uniref:Uncharacterized protein n=1 Tax=Saccharopolyspora gregorii TaxID=33914 RepID=A0ABP6RNJ6_9PSEU